MVLLTTDWWAWEDLLVGLGGLEPPTSRLSSARSNQLSYKPDPQDGAQQQNCRPQSVSRKGSSKKKEKRRRRRPAIRKGAGSFKPVVRKDGGLKHDACPVMF
jgi:hypothetical protein